MLLSTRLAGATCCCLYAFSSLFSLSIQHSFWQHFHQTLCRPESHSRAFMKVKQRKVNRMSHKEKQDDTIWNILCWFLEHVPLRLMSCRTDIRYQLPSNIIYLVNLILMATYFGASDHHLANLHKLNLGVCSAVM